jgi:hypothetical protein
MRMVVGEENVAPDCVLKLPHRWCMKQHLPSHDILTTYTTLQLLDNTTAFIHTHFFSTPPTPKVDSGRIRGHQEE